MSRCAPSLEETFTASVSRIMGYDSHLLKTDFKECHVTITYPRLSFGRFASCTIITPDERTWRLGCFKIDDIVLAQYCGSRFLPPLATYSGHVESPINPFQWLKKTPICCICSQAKPLKQGYYANDKPIAGDLRCEDCFNVPADTRSPLVPA